MTNQRNDAVVWKLGLACAGLALVLYFSLQRGARTTGDPGRESRALPPPAGSAQAEQPESGASVPAPLRREEAPKVGDPGPATAPIGHVTGRIVDARGAPVAGASARLWVEQRSESVRTFVPVQDAETRAGGDFHFEFRSAARYRLTARAHGIGTAAVEELALEAGEDHVVGDLVLSGGAPILGRVATIDGQAVAELELWAIDTNYALEADALARAALRADADERGDGLAFTKTRTDAQGAFRLGGLKAGHYALRSPDARVVLEPRQARYEPGTTDVRITCESARLIVRVVDVEGRPATTAGVRVTEISTGPDGTTTAHGTRTLGVDPRSGVAAFVLDPEAPVAVEAFAMARASSEELVVLGRNEFVRELRLVLRDPAGKGRIRLALLGEDGAPFEHVVVNAYTPLTRLVREDLGTLAVDAEGRLPPLPAGSYHLAIGYAPGTDRGHFVVRTSEPVVVRADAETLVALTARRGARVRVSLETRGAPPEAWSRAGKFAPEDRRERFGARVVLAPGTPAAGVPLQFRTDTGEGLVSAILPGESLVAEGLVERGTHAISLTADSLTLAAPLTVDLVPGESNELRLVATWR